MPRILIHPGTGTYIGLDDGLYVVDTDKFDNDYDRLEAEMEDIVEAHGIPMSPDVMPQATHYNSILLSPEQLRVEAVHLFSELFDDDTLAWVEKVSDKELARATGHIIETDEVLWNAVGVAIREAIMYVKATEGCYDK